MINRAPIAGRAYFYPKAYLHDIVEKTLKLKRQARARILRSNAARLPGLA